MPSPRFRIRTLIAAVAVIAAIFALYHEGQREIQRRRVPPLARARHAAALACYRDTLKRFDEGEVSFDDYCEASRKLMVARRELGDSNADHVVAASEHLDRVRMIVERMTQSISDPSDENVTQRAARRIDFVLREAEFLASKAEAE